MGYFYVAGMNKTRMEVMLSTDKDCAKWEIRPYLSKDEKQFEKIWNATEKHCIHIIEGSGGVALIAPGDD